MNRDQIKAEIQAVGDWRHPFELEPGQWVNLHRDWYKQWHLWRVETLMPTIAALAARLRPGGLSGARVLDTGCWDGFYGFEFLKRGAGYLLGVDLREEAIRRANLIKAYYGYPNCDFTTANVQKFGGTGEPFDITLLYGLLYHLTAPIDVLHTLGGMTRTLLLINTYASPDPEPFLRLKREDPGKDSTGFQELVTVPTQSALAEMVHFAGFDVLLREVPYPFFERYRASDFGFFYAFRSAPLAGPELEALLRDLKVSDRYDPRLRRTQLVRIRRPAPLPGKLTRKRRLALRLHRAVDRLLP